MFFKILLVFILFCLLWEITNTLCAFCYVSLLPIIYYYQYSTSIIDYLGQIKWSDLNEIKLLAINHWTLILMTI